MRIISLISILVLFFMTSCKKDWICQCEPTGDNPNYLEVTHIHIEDMNQSNARSECKTNETKGFQCDLR